jgi:hypothetical protein
MKPWRYIVAVFGAVLALIGTASADIAFPARLDVVEREPGVYDISFTLPIVEGRKLRAEPRMSPTCVESSPREAGVSSGGLTTTWSVRCEPASLAGEAIIVEGLLGTQTDLAFTLTMLDGRRGLFWSSHADSAGCRRHICRRPFRRSVARWSGVARGQSRDTKHPDLGNDCDTRDSARRGR